MQKEKTEVGVNSESVEEIYRRYTQDKYQINRRYQRKLVWGNKEKEKLIDSLCNNIPIPLILLAEVEDKEGKSDGRRYEIIDGLQRMNAIVSFIENSYQYQGKYFNLGASAITSRMRDKGLEQKTPVLDVDISRSICEYRLPVSTYRSAEPQTIDEVFRRINSSGKKLSMQEVRQAGALSHFAELVQDIAAEIRGDVTPGKKISLSEAPRISIVQKNTDGEKGIYSKDIFWVKNKILREKEVREESRDEELILDLLMGMLYRPGIRTTRKENRDAAYKNGQDANLLDSQIDLIGYDELKKRFLRVYEIICFAVGKSGKIFLDLILPNRSENSHSAPRHYYAIFIAIYSIVYEDDKTQVDYNLLSDALAHVYKNDIVSIQHRGGVWESENKESAHNHMKLELLEKGAFKESDSDDHKHLAESRINLESNLRRSLMETEMLELKIGFTLLSNEPTLNEEIVREVCRTATAMSNTITESEGVIYIGIADTNQSANRVKDLYNISPYVFNDTFNIVGTRHELERLEYDIDRLHQWFRNKACTLDFDSSYRNEIVRNLKPILYNEYLVWELKVPRVSEPVLFEREYWHRVGSSTVKVETPEMISFINSFSEK